MFLLIVYKNITKNNNLLNLAIQNKNIKTNISHPLTEKNYNPNFSFFLKENIYIIKYGDSHDRMVVGFITTYINKNILGLQLSQDWDVYTGTFVDLTMKLTKLTLQAWGPLYPGNNFLNELTFQQN
jgi:hypothetical protein